MKIWQIVNTSFGTFSLPLYPNPHPFRCVPDYFIWCFRIFRKKKEMARRHLLQEKTRSKFFCIVCIHRSLAKQTNSKFGSLFQSRKSFYFFSQDILTGEINQMNRGEMCQKAISLTLQISSLKIFESRGHVLPGVFASVLLFNSWG